MAAFPRRKVNYFEWCRAFGALAVVLLHTIIEMRLHVFVGEQAQELSAGRAVAYSFISTGFTRWAVPVFFMVTGALLLDPQKHMRNKYVWHYAQRIVFVLGTFGLAFAAIELYVDGVPVGWGLVVQAVFNVLTANSWDHLWYLYALLDIYLLLPALRSLVRHTSQKAFLACIVLLAVVTMVLPAGWSYLTGELPGPGVFVTQYVPSITYVLLGYYLHNYVRWNPGWGIVGVAVWCVAVAGSMSRTLLGLETGMFDLPYSPLTCILSAVVFLGIRRCLDAVPLAEHPLFATVARYSFGIYVLHVVFLHAAVRLLTFVALPAGIAEALLFAIALGGGLGLTWLLHRVPVFCRYL